MRKIETLAAGLLVAVASPAATQDVDATVEEGRAVYEENCAACHQPNGEGIPPNFPALDGNEKLADHALIVIQVRAGKEAMPAFPQLTVEEVGAVASYVRSAWSNNYGPVSTAEAAEVLEGVEVREAERSIWDGVYTTAQADSARLYYLGACAPCHGRRMNGAPDEADMSPGPPLAGVAFRRAWDGRTLGALFEYMRTTMPVRNPGQLSDQRYADIIAYMLDYDGVPAGDQKLGPDMNVLTDIVIEGEPPSETVAE